MAGLVSSVLVLTAACGGSSGGSSDTASSATKGSITWWGFAPTVKGVADQYIASFNKAYPHIKVTFRQIPINSYDATMRPALLSPQGPDVFEVAPGGGIASINSFGRFAIDMAPVIKKSLGADWKSKVAPAGIPGLTQDGKFVALPIGETYGGSLWINNGIFDKYGLTPPTTYDSWVKVCRALKPHKVNCLAMGAGQVAFNQDVLQEVTDIVKPGVWTQASKGDISWDNPSVVEALTIWKKMFDDGIMEPGALGLQHYPDANNHFVSGKAAMVMMGTWYMNQTTKPVLKEAISGAGVGNPQLFTAVAIPFPDVAGHGNPATMWGDPDWGLAVNAKSKNKAPAETFASFLTTTQKGQQAVADTVAEITSLKGVSPTWAKVDFVDRAVQQPMLEQLIAKSLASTEPRLSLVSAKLQQAIGDASQTVASGKATPEEAAKTLQQTMGSS
jgi:ABC-type glycerol-3-phosphate transport system substrate-binding protein